MTQKKLTDAITSLDYDILERYFLMKQELVEKKKTKKFVFAKWETLAACFCIIILASIFILPNIIESAIEDNPNIMGSNVEDNLNCDGAPPGIKQACFDFDSYEEMIDAFAKQDLKSDSYTIQELKDALGEPFIRFVDKVNADKAFPQPMLDNKPITYRNEEGFSNIAFFGKELYDLPWVGYHPFVSTGENFYIKITYIPDGIKDNQKRMTASEVIKKIAPNSANIDNPGKQHKGIYNRQITLYDREVTALVMEYKEDTRSGIYFVYDELLVLVRCDLKVWDEQWFSNLSFHY